MAYGGPANTYVQNAAGVWTPVGFAAGNASMPGVLRDPTTVANAASVDARGNVEVKDEMSTILYESFSAALDTVNTWTITGTGPTVAGGLGTFPTAVSTTSGIISIPVMPVRASQYLAPAFVVRLETTAATGLGRFFGLGTTPAWVTLGPAPSATSLAQEGAGFELDSATGALHAATYTAGVKTVIAVLTRPTDNANHRYSMNYRGSRTYWFIDGLQVATATYLNTALQDLPVSFFQVSTATLTGIPQTVVQSLGVGDESRLHTYLSDATYPWRRAQVSAAGALSTGLTVSPTPVTTTMQAAVAATGPGTSLVVTGYGTAVLQVSGTFVASVAFEASVDAGVTWTSISATQIGAGDIFSSTTIVGAFRITTTGIDLLRARVSSFTSGAVTVVGRATNAINASKVVKLATSGNVVGRVLPTASDLAVSVTAAASTALTATLPAAAAGLFHYITSIEIQRYASAALTGAAAPVVVTTTNLPGTLAWTFDTAAAIGTSQIQAFALASPIKSSAAATATTFVAPLFTGAIWRITITYYIGI